MVGFKYCLYFLLLVVTLIKFAEGAETAEWWEGQHKNNIRVSSFQNCLLYHLTNIIFHVYEQQATLL